jgi:phosphoglycolate phosphatase
MSTPVRVIAFDLDGTLIDSRLDLAAAVNLARADFGLAALATEAVVAMIGEGARNLVRRAIADLRKGGPSDAEVDSALDRFRAHYALECTRRTRPFPGIDALLAALAPRWPLALVTNKPESHSRTIVDHLGWAGRFDPLIGGDTFATRKPDPEGLHAVCARHGVGPAELLLVGDSRIDARAAHAAGCRFVCVSWGFARPDERVELESETTIDAPGELLDRLEGRSGRLP